MALVDNPCQHNSLHSRLRIFLRPQLTGSNDQRGIDDSPKQRNRELPLRCMAIPRAKPQGKSFRPLPRSPWYDLLVLGKQVEDIIKPRIAFSEIRGFIVLLWPTCMSFPKIIFVQGLLRADLDMK